MTPEDLMNVLRDLRKDDFLDFKWHLQQDDILEGCAVIAKEKLDYAKRRDTVDVMVQTYTLPGAVDVTGKILTLINRSDLVQRLGDSRSGSGELQQRPDSPGREPQTCVSVTGLQSNEPAMEVTEPPSETREECEKRWCVLQSKASEDKGDSSCTGSRTPAKHMSQDEDTAFNTLGQLDMSISERTEGSERTEPSQELRRSTFTAAPTPSLLDRKLDAEIDVLRQHKRVLCLQEEYYKLKIEHLKKTNHK
ncbi:hypothetical protein Q5P01_025810 [Channa striata]|uniref:Pyrin domain-containing protein n=1 Tax=Channa striata TaxID=64152 RepID=A0AA88LIH9_CHASR|nr:hypothetical protein Q5P01_025810 [Channa striata]